MPSRKGAMSLDMSRYRPEEREAVRRCVHAAHAVGAVEVTRGLSDCVYGLLSELRDIDDERLLLFLRYMLQNNENGDDLAARVALVLRPPGFTLTLSSKYQEFAPSVARDLPMEILDRAAFSAVAVRLNTYPITSEGRYSGLILCRYANNLYKGLVSPKGNDQSMAFTAALQGKCRLPDGTDVLVQTS
jgi:hypothetical protein